MNQLIVGISAANRVVFLGEENTSVTLHRFGSNTTAPAADTNVGAIVAATGWMFNSKGEDTLISHAPSATSLGSTSATCHKQ